MLRRRFLVALLVAAQASFFVYFLFNTSYFSSVIIYIFNAISVLVALFVLAGHGESSYKLTWVFVILTFPVVGGILYLYFDQHFLRFSLIRRARRVETRIAPVMRSTGSTACIAAEHPKSLRYLSDFVGYPAYADADTTFFASGREMLERLKEELARAERYIFMEYFIIEHGEMWDDILDILLDKVNAGVEVRIIYDDMGCFLRLPHKYVKILEKYGIRAARFNPFVPFFSAEQNNRDHRKITVIDGKVAFTGGINIADEYIGSIERFGKWADTAVMVEGDAAWSFALMFLQMWEIVHKNENEDLLRYLPAKSSEDVTAKEDALPKTESDAKCSLVLPYADSPLDSENVGALVYMDIIQNAKKYVYITTPYLVIDDQMRNALTFAAKSGVDVRIITPHKWDKKLVHMTTRSYYRALWECGVKIYEYTPGFMHAKTVVADDEIATVGSINFDYRSLYLHFECGVYLYNTPSVLAVKDTFLAFMDASEEIVPALPRRDVFSAFCRAVMRLLAPLL